MLFSTSSSPAFSWHLQTDTLLFCTSALAMLGMREDTAPATMEALLEHVPPFPATAAGCPALRRKAARSGLRLCLQREGRQ